MHLANLGDLEIIYDHRPLGLELPRGSHGHSQFVIREGSLEEIFSSTSGSSIRMFVSSPDRLRTALSSHRNSIQKLRSTPNTGLFLVEGSQDRMTVRLKKSLAERGMHQGGHAFIDHLSHPFSYNDLTKAILSAAESLYLKSYEQYFKSISAIREVETRAMHDLGSALSSHASASEMGKLVLDKCMSVSDADAGFLLMSDMLFEDSVPDGKTVKVLGNVGDVVSERARRCMSQNVRMSKSSLSKVNDSLFKAVCKIGRAIAWNESGGYLVPHGLMLDDMDEPEHLSFEFDEKLYRVINFCLVPIRVPTGDVIGAVVLINRRSEADVFLDNLELMEGFVREFSVSDLIMLEALAHQAGVSLDHARLIKNLQTVFESFVQASVVAIESRDPSTKGHSIRVATLTVALAEAVNAETSGPLANLNFSPTQLYELKYASLLHDFGKIGVREDVLQKEKKLFPYELAEVRERFLHLERSLYLRCIESYLEGLMARAKIPTEEDLARIRREVDRVTRELRYFWAVINEANEPQVVKSGSFQAMAELASIRVLMDDNEMPLLTPYELERLSIRRGSLSHDERLEIERHVSNSYRFLLQIPWTRELASLPAIVHAHHERLDGSGYPLGLKKQDIPAQAQIMAVCDIYDALIAMDRPYKKALPHDRAMAILESEVQEGKLESLFFNLFRDRETFKLVLDKDFRVAS